MKVALLEIEGLKTQFFTSAGTVRAVDGVDYTVEEGEAVAVVGESGCGKSVTALSIMRLVADPPGKITEGQIRFKGTDLVALPEEEMRQIRGRDIGMVFQEPMTSLNPVLSIGRQLTETLETHFGMSREKADDAVLRLNGELGQRVEVGVEAALSAREQRAKPRRLDVFQDRAFCRLVGRARLGDAACRAPPRELLVELRPGGVHRPCGAPNGRDTRLCPRPSVG